VLYSQQLRFKACIATVLLVLVAAGNGFSQCAGGQSGTVTPAPSGSCVPGTVYTFCYTMVGYSQAGANWTDGFEINLGGPWVPGSLVGTTPPVNCNGGGGNWMWANTVIGSSTGQSNGPGYFFDLNIDGNPGNDYGDLGAGCTWTICFQATVGNSPGATLTVGVTALGDGEIGSWNSNACVGSVFPIFNCVINNPCGTLNAVVNQNETCPGNANGSATATMTGSAPITYSWNTVPVQNTATATGLTAGNYTVTGSAGGGCVMTNTVNITTGTSANATINNINPTNTLCQSNAPVQITTVQAGGSFSGPGVNATGLFNPANANIGLNTITYSIGGPCPATQTLAITVVQDADATINPINPTNQICTGSNPVQLTAASLGGTWSGPGVNASGIFNPLTAGVGIHTITYTIAGPCGDVSTMNITVSDLTATVSSSQSTCTANNGTATVTPTSGSAPYSYSWNSAPIQTTQTAVNLPAGTYNVVVQDGQGCALTLQSVVAFNAGNLSVSTVVTPSVCTSLNGTATVVPLGGTLPYSIDWNTVPVQNTATAVGLAAGNYTATVQDANGCVATGSSVVALDPSNLSASTVVTPSVCTSLNGTATVVPLGGTLPYNIAWNTVPVQNTATAVGLAAGNYTATVQDANGCVATGSSVVALDPGNLTVSVSSSTNVSCNGFCDGQASAMIAGGTAPFLSVWDDPSFQQTPIATGLCAGTYNVGVADVNGCLATAQTTITEPTLLVANAVMDIQSNCGNPDGQATVTASGGSIATNYGYSWNSSPAQSNAIATSLAPANYIVTVTDDNGCSTNANVTVTSTPGFSASIISSSNATCFQLCNGTATAQAGPGVVLPVSYSWNTTPVQNSATANNLCSGNHVVTMVDDVGCLATANILISEPTLVTTTVSTSASPICIGESSTLTASASGGTQPYSSYLWVASPADPTLNANQLNTTVSPLTTTTYNFIATDANGCSSAASAVTVQVRQPLNLSIVRPVSSPDTGICPYDFAVIDLQATGGDGNYTYYLAPDNLNPVSLPMQVQPNSTTTYSFQVSDGCTTPPAFASSTIEVYLLPNVNFSGDLLSGCHEHTTSFTDLTSPTPVAWSWDFGDPSSVGNYQSISNPSHQFSAPGLYTVSLQVTSGDGCLNDTIKPSYIEVFPVPIANFSANPERTTVLQADIDFTDLSSGNLASWNWDFGTGDTSGIQNPSYQYLDTGMFTVRLLVTSVDGCTDVTRRTVVIDPDFMFYVPNAFSPNMDGRNDYFRGYGEGVNWDTYELTIYNRWGEEIFYSADVETPWRGWFKDREVEVGVYVWKIRIFSTSGIEHVYRGGVSLLR
jgi:gliding motility-associated-like protein